MMYSPLFFALVARTQITNDEYKELSKNNAKNRAGKSEWDKYLEKWGEDENTVQVKARGEQPKLMEKAAPAPEPAPAPVSKPAPLESPTAELELPAPKPKPAPKPAKKQEQKVTVTAPAKITKMLNGKKSDKESEDLLAAKKAAKAAAKKAAAKKAAAEKAAAEKAAAEKAAAEKAAAEKAAAEKAAAEKAAAEKAEAEKADAKASIHDWLHDEDMLDQFFLAAEKYTNKKFQNDPEMKKRYENARAKKDELLAAYGAWASENSEKNFNALQASLNRIHPDFWNWQKE